MPTFCRHNRFLERCPICSKTLPGRPVTRGRGARGTAPRPASSTSGAPRRPRLRAENLQVHREGRAQDDGYRSTLLPGLRASADASRLVEEIAFASGRLLALGAAPPDLYAEVRALATDDLEQATWSCFLIAYLSPLDGEDPFAGIRLALTTAFGGSGPILGSAAAANRAGRTAGGDGTREQRSEELPDLDGVPLGPRTSHDPARGRETLLAYRHWVEHACRSSADLRSGGGTVAGGGGQAVAFTGDSGWSPQRRFERLFERLALPGFGRMGRYDLLVTLGRLGLYELRADSLHLAGAAGRSSRDLTMLAAKRLFAIGDPLHLERRAAALAEAIPVAVETLDLALANWASPQRATLGFPPDTCDRHALERARHALAL